MLNVTTYPLGPIQTNCYIIDNGSECLIIDPGDEAGRLIRMLERDGLRPLAILLTHAHFDHIGGVEEVRNHFTIPVHIHEAESDWLQTPELNGSARYPGLPLISGRPADHLVQAEGEAEIGPFRYEIRHTPGHSPGSLTYVFPDGGFAIVGDTLFRQSIGRTDLPGGDTETLLESIHNRLLTLDDEFILYPGHGPSTTPGDEKDTNPFLNGF